MKIQTRNVGNNLELIVRMPNVHIFEEIAVLEKKLEKWIIEDYHINQVLTAAFDMNKFNQKPNIRLVEKIVKNYLSKDEIGQLIKNLSNE